MEKQAILVYLETADGQIVKVSLEALNAACKLAAQTGKTVTAVLVGDGRDLHRDPHCPVPAV